MGTVGYMSPEQVRRAGRRSPRRHLLARVRALRDGRGPARVPRDTAAETMTAILREDPPELPRETGVRPAGVRSIVRHCLEKRPEERFQSARDLAFALRSLLGSSASGEAALSVATPPASPAASPRHLRR